MAAQQRFHAGISDSLRGTLDCLSGRRICCLEKQGLDAKSPQLLAGHRQKLWALLSHSSQYEIKASHGCSSDIDAETKSSRAAIGTVT